MDMDGVDGQYMCMSKNGRMKTMCVTSDNAQIAIATCGCCGDCPADTCEGDDDVDCTLDDEEDGGGDGWYMCMTLGNGKNITKCVADEDILQKGLMGATCGCCGESCPAENCDDDDYDCIVEESEEDGSFMCFIIGNGKPKVRCVDVDEVFEEGLKQGGVCGCCGEDCPESTTALPP